MSAPAKAARLGAFARSLRTAMSSRASYMQNQPSGCHAIIALNYKMDTPKNVTACCGNENGVVRTCAGQSCEQ